MVNSLGFCRENIKFEKLTKKIFPQSKLVQIWQLKGGISAQMTAFEIILPNNQVKKMIVRSFSQEALKQNPYAATNEFKLLQLLHPLEVRTQTPYFFDTSGEIFSTPYCVLEYIEGKPEFMPLDLDNFVLQLATNLAQIHSIGNFDAPFLLKHPKGFVETINFVPSSEEGHIRQTLESVWPLSKLNKSTLLHGDFWPGNILWQNGKLVAVIDWEDAQFGDPLMDFAISRLDILWGFGIDAMYKFSNYYKSMTKFDFSNLPYWDLCAALRPISNMAQWASVYPSVGRKDITEKTMQEGHSWFVAQAFEKLNVEN